MPKPRDIAFFVAGFIAGFVVVPLLMNIFSRFLRVALPRRVKPRCGTQSGGARGVPLVRVIGQGPQVSRVASLLRFLVSPAVR